MSRDYKNIKKKKPKTFAERFSNGLSFISGLAVGLLVAIVIYFQGYNSTIEINNPLLKKEPSATDEGKDADEKPATELPEPKFDFYTILPNRQVNISEWETAEETSDTEPSDEPVLYVLQVGSFKQFEAADEIKAKLAFMGITADIQRVVINGFDVRHRVRIGPYEDTDKLRQARDMLSANDMDFVLLKLKK